MKQNIDDCSEHIERKYMRPFAEEVAHNIMVTNKYDSYIVDWVLLNDNGDECDVDMIFKDGSKTIHKRMVLKYNKHFFIS